MIIIIIFHDDCHLKFPPPRKWPSPAMSAGEGHGLTRAKRT
jgi:hypothetical protein